MHLRFHCVSFHSPGTRGVGEGSGHLRFTVTPILQDSGQAYCLGQWQLRGLNSHVPIAKALIKREVQKPQFKLLVYWEKNICINQQTISDGRNANPAFCLS